MSGCLTLDKMLICWDVDGTIDCKENDKEEYLKGIVPEDDIVRLWIKGHQIAICSPSPYFPDKWKGDNHWFKRNGSNFSRWENIKDAMKHYNVTDKDKVIYVDDLLGNLKIIRDVYGIKKVYTPQGFMEEIPELLK